MTKEEFLTRYNPNRSENHALSKSIGASVGRNPTYTANLNNSDKSIFRTFWATEIITIGMSFNEPRDLKYYLQQVQNLANTINQDYYNTLQPHKPNYDNGFRIAHSQKSISVFLKHLWCMELIPEPPCCPIDRMISLKAKYPLDVSWTKMNSIDQIERTLIGFRTLAENNNQTIAEWELKLF
jgi:hypothetical protein